MVLGLTKGEILLVVFIFALIYAAGLLPRIVKALAGEEANATPPPTPPSSDRVGGLAGSQTPGDRKADDAKEA